MQVLKAFTDIKGTAEAVTIDVTDDAFIQATAEHVEQEYGHLDCLINNSGVSNRSQTPAEQIRENLAVKTVGPVVVSDTFLHLLKKSIDPSPILVTSSLGSLQVSSGSSSIDYNTRADYPSNYYRASKAALNMTLIKFQKREGDKIKMWGGETGWLATDLANAEMMRKVGAPHLSVWLEQIASCVKGERDADVGKILDKYGIRMW